MKVNFKNNKLPHLIIVGGGFAGLTLIKLLSKKPINVTLIDKHNYHTFQPLLYQVASGGLGEDSIAYPLRKTVGKMPNIAYRMAEVLEILADENTIFTSIGDFKYDYLCLATGSTTNFFGNTDLEKYCMQLKSIPQALDIRHDILQEFELAINNPNEADANLNFVIVGGGPTGVETAGAIAEIKKHVLPADYTELDASRMQIHLMEASGKLLVGMSEVSSKKALQFLVELGVNVHLNTAVKSYNGKVLTLNNNEIINTKTVIWAAGVKGKSIKGIQSSSIGKGNRYLVNAYNQIINYPNIFAIGDLALMQTDLKYPNGHPMVAPVAVQQANLFASNILSIVKNQKPDAFYYFDKGSMATVGRHKAVFESFGIKMQGYIAWLGWMFLHLMLLVGFRNRLVVFVNWLWNYLTYQRAIRIITRQFKEPE